MQKKLGINAILNMIKSIMGMLFPLVTYPYVSRILSVENIGKVNYTSAVIGYFVLFAMLGIQVYATREGASIRNDKAKVEKFVSEVFTLNIIAAIISSVVLIVLLVFTDIFRDYTMLLMIYAVEIPLVVIGSDWINTIYEDYVYISVRTIAFQLLSMVLIFFTVRQKTDFYNYAGCLVISAYGAGVLNAFYTRKYCRKRLVLSRDVFKHLRPVLILFAISFAALIYSSIGTTMLGFMTSDYHVGIYTTAAKVYNIFKQMVFAIVIVCLPRFSYILANEGREKYKKLVNSLYNIVIFMAIPLTVGIYFLSDPIIYLLAGPDFSEAATTLRLLSVATLLAILSYFQMQLVLLPNKKDSAILIATVIAGIVNIVVNYILIPFYYENAAAFSTMLSELIVLIVTCISGRKIITVKPEISNLFTVVISAGLMGMGIKIVCSRITGAFSTLFVGFMVGLVVYGLALVITRNKVILDVYRLIKNRFITKNFSNKGT